MDLANESVRSVNDSCGEKTILDLSREAKEELEKAEKMKPHKLGQEVDFVEVRIARLRDCLIENLRKKPDSQLAPTWRYALERANIALSFVVGVEYPVTGIHRKLLEQASQVLKELIRKVESVKAPS